ncbi:MAG TPA: MopE-related protein [Polyangiales bacterium]|nr:MopE-related protein [Polyangiales bacterium]
MQRRDWSLYVAVVGAACFLTSHASAQPLKPYFLVIFDTSGSMQWCAGGNESPDYGANDCSCLNNTAGPCFGTSAAPPADSAFKKNRCGFPANRIGDAKCALQRIVDATSGEAVFGLMQFAHTCSNSCTGVAISSGGSMCSASAYDEAQLVVGLQNNNTTLLREWVDGTNNCQGSCTNNFTHELYSGVWTPIGKSLQRANEYLRGNAAQGSFQYPTNPAGFNVAPGSPLANDSKLACRPVSVILLTDGKETCGGNGTTAAQALYGGGSSEILGSNIATKAFRTYVIGFGSSGNSFDPAALNAIAQAGGTDSPDPNNRYFPAANEAQLSVALTQIINDAQPPMEVCNGKDDDCDGNSDEGITKFCNKPINIVTKELCDEPNETLCDGMDDDCDGIIDEGLKNVCGSCGEVPKEVCDGVDNDCDLRIDENTGGEACGSDVGECKKGMLVCVDGTEKCEGATGPQPEICDCKDNDCDGNIDEEAEAGKDPLCPGEQKCAGCKCVKFCQVAQEFGQMCEAGLAPDVQPSGECLCVADNCDRTSCAARTIMQDDELACGPNSKTVGTCVCAAGECAPRCAGVTCGGDTICSKKTGECVENNCRGLGCEAGQLCDPMSAKCIEDKCKTTKCADNEVCRQGDCEKSCAAVTCASGQRCTRGECVEDKCSGKDCLTGLVCDSATGACGSDPCEDVFCPKGQACAPDTGSCAADPCFGVTCPENQSCDRGECKSRSSTPTTPEEEEEKPPSRGNRQIAVSGGGGCSCDVPGPIQSGSPVRKSLLGLSLLLLAAARLRRRRPEGSRLMAATLPMTIGRPRCAAAPAKKALPAGLWTLLLVVLASPVLTACKVTPLCLDSTCEDAGKPERDKDSGAAPEAGTGGSGGSGGAGGSEDADASTDAGPDADAGPKEKPDAAVMCKPSPETCNAKDDDCDLRADEDVTAPQNNCMQRGVCAGTAPVCAGGKFVCRYGADYEMDETRCDGKDNDCDGKIDESFPMLGSSCESGVGACKVKGTRRCNAAGTGLSCDFGDPKTPGDEVCNGEDDDCDGMIDEPKAAPGTNPSYVHDDMVQVGPSLWVYKYEASRADATGAAGGILTTRACSRAGVLPWTNLTYAQAKAACEASGLSICSRSEWLTACHGDGGCAFSSTGCNNYNAQCNGHDVSATPGSPDTDVLKPTGSMADCYASFGSNRVFDLSGNAKELTMDSNSPSQNPLSGGSYSNAPMGLQCDFDFSVGGADLHLPNVGFRCCTTSGAP